MTKVCSKCKQEKELEKFHKNKLGKYGLHHYCKSCNSIQKKKSYNYEKSKVLRISNKYNLTRHQVEELYISQNKKCKICNIESLMISKHKGLYIDHCHKTGKVRGLLCASCNKLLGDCKDSIEILKSSILYLTESIQKL
jgi:hypothetical protein